MSRNTSVVLDTHVWIWLAAGQGELRQSALKLLEKASSGDGILIPAIAVWEVALLAQKGKISFDKPIVQWIKDALSGPGISLAELTPEICLDSVSLPGDFHKDPADRLIVATARVERARLITRDSRILNYGKQGYLEVIPA